MKEPDHTKLDYVSGLSRLAEIFIENRKFESAEQLAEDIAKCDYPILSSDIFIKTGNIARAREILVQHAEDLCKAGMHIRAAACYKNVGMLQEYCTELKEHELEYETKFRGKKPS